MLFKTDFGESKEVSKEEEKVEASFVGTPETMAPEMLNNNSSGPSSDLWALGCIIYQIRLGVTPFHAKAEGIIM